MADSLWWMGNKDGSREVAIKDKEITDHAAWEPLAPFDPSNRELPPPVIAWMER